MQFEQFFSVTANFAVLFGQITKQNVFSGTSAHPSSSENQFRYFS